MNNLFTFVPNLKLFLLLICVYYDNPTTYCLTYTCFLILESIIMVLFRSIVLIFNMNMFAGLRVR